MKREKMYIAAFKLLLFAMMVFAILLFLEIKEIENADAKVIGAVYQSEEADWINVWNRPRTSLDGRKKIGEFNGDRRIRVYEIRNGYGRVSFGGKRGWIRMRNMTCKKSGWVKIEGEWKKVKKVVKTEEWEDEA